MRPRLGRLVLDRPWALVAVAVVAAAAWWAIGTRQQDHHVRVAFDDALNLAPGLDVQAAGVDVGKVSSVAYEDGQAIVTLGIDSGPAWPLHRGTTATLRLGSTVGNGNRRVELTPGRADAPPVPDDGVLSAGAGKSPVEVDQVQQVFGPVTRRSTRALTANAARALAGDAPANLNRGIRRLPGAVTATGGVAGELADNGAWLSLLIARGDRVSHTLDVHRNRVAGLVRVAGATLDTIARNSRDVTSTLDQAPATLAQARVTLRRVDPTLRSLQGFLVAVDPGLRRLPALARVSNPALAQLQPLVGEGARLADRAATTAPAITSLLTHARPLVDAVGPVAQQAAPMIDCIRPFAPDLAGFAAGWASWAQEYDDTTHYARVRFYETASGLSDMPNVKTADFARLTGLTYNGIPAAGTFVGQPQYDPNCATTQANTDPAHDPSDRP